MKGQLEIISSFEKLFFKFMPPRPSWYGVSTAWYKSKAEPQEGLAMTILQAQQFEPISN